MRDIGKNIRTLRERKGLTQDQLAEKLFVTRQTVSNYETGRSRPDIDTLLRIAEILGVDIHTVLYGPQTDPLRKKKWLHFGTACACLIALFLFILILKRRTYYYQVNSPLEITLLSWAHIFLRPIGLILAGWTLMQGLHLVAKLMPFYTAKCRWFRLSILILSICYLIIMLPFVLNISGIPIQWYHMGFFLMGIYPNQPEGGYLVTVALGAALWLFRPPREP